MCLVLRHKPQNFGLSLDQYGFVKIEELLVVLKNRYRETHPPDLETVVRNCPKGRFEIRGEKIRARYGHSIDVMLDTEPFQPPDYLYHATSPATKDAISTDGIKPMTRRYVHLSKSKDEAFQVGRRKSTNPIIFNVKAREAYQKGVKFYDMGVVVLTEAIAAEFIQSTD
jgi:putative RNA 2'-phosphotransferase